MGLSRIALCAALALLAGQAQAQDARDYPDRPIHVVAPVSAGSGLDSAARITAAAAEKALGGTFIIDNLPGAGQRLGAATVAKSSPDGYTLLFTNPGPIAVAQFFPPKLNYDPESAFRPVATGMFQPVVLIVRPGLGVKTVDEFVDYAKKNPGKLSFGVQGLGTEIQLMLERFKQVAGIDVTTVPYNSGAPGVIDLLGGRLDAMFLVVPTIKNYLDDKKLLALATVSPKRIEALPDVPTMTELGRPEVTSAIWFGYLAPAKTPDAVIEKLAGAFASLKSDTALSKRVSDLGAELDIVGPTQFGKIIDADRRRYGKIVADGHLAKPE